MPLTCTVCDTTKGVFEPQAVVGGPKAMPICGPCKKFGRQPSLLASMTPLSRTAGTGTPSSTSRRRRRAAELTAARERAERFADFFAAVRCARLELMPFYTVIGEPVEPGAAGVMKSVPSDDAWSDIEHELGEAIANARGHMDGATLHDMLDATMARHPAGRRTDVTEIPAALANRLTAQGQRVTACGGVPFIGHTIDADDTTTASDPATEGVDVIPALAADPHPLSLALRDLATAQALVTRAMHLTAVVTPVDEGHGQRLGTLGASEHRAHGAIADALERLQNLGVA